MVPRRSSWPSDARSGPQNVVDRSIEKLKQTDVYVGIFAKQYGEVTAREYRAACELGKPRFVYVRDKGAERDAELQRFLRFRMRRSRAWRWRGSRPMLHDSSH